MKRKPLALALMALFASGSSAALDAVAGEHCPRCRSNQKSCVSCADRGILSLLNVMAKKVDSSITNALPANSACDAGCDTHGHATHKHACGTELKPPSCGCEVSGPSCGCEQHATSNFMTLPLMKSQPPGMAGNSSSGTVDSRFPLPKSYDAEEFVTPDSPLGEVPPLGTIRPGVRVPAPRSTPVNPVSPGEVPASDLPDSAVNPFMDDSASMIRRSSPTRAFGNVMRKSNSQANSGGLYFHLDDSNAMQPATAADKTDGVTTASNQGLRRIETFGGNAKLHAPPEVVTASSTMLQRIEAANAASRNKPANSAQEASGSQTSRVSNPLR